MKLGRTDEEFWYKTTPVKTFALINIYIDELKENNKQYEGMENNQVETTIDQIPFF